MPGLSQGVQNFLGGILNNPQQFLGQFAPGGMQQSNLLQQRLGNVFQQTLAANPQGNTFQQRYETAFGRGLPGMEAAVNIPDVSGAKVIEAAQPIFQRNLSQALQTQREFGGPRFASESGRQARQMSEQALQDFNLFQQNVLESGLQRQLGAAQLGVQQQLGRRGLELQQQQQMQSGLLGAMGLDVNAAGQGIQQQLGLGNLWLGSQQLGSQGLGQQLAFLGPLLQSAIAAGGGTSAPALLQNPGGWANFINTIGTLGGLGTSAFGFGGPFGSGGAFG